MQTQAKLRHLRISPRKVRLVADLIRGLDTGVAQHRLKFTPKRSSAHLLKLLNSAVANAEHNFKLEPTNLKIDSIMVDQGPTLKRWRARAFGRANQIQKKTSHITIVLGEKVEGLKAEVKKSKKKVTETPKKEKRIVSESQRAAKRIEKKGLKGLGSKLFRRKSI